MALLAKLRPRGPWRAGPDSGDRLRVGRVLHSDALYSALTHAFIDLGELDGWLDATAMHVGGAQVRSSSCFPFAPGESGDTLFLPPPESHWPPPDSLRIRWKSARFIPPAAIWQLLNDKPLIEEHWAVDGVSECLLPVMRNVPGASPFRVTIRSRAAVDRLGQGIEPHQTACLEFSRGSGIWIAFSFANEEAEARWSGALKGALKLIADSGLGGERSSGWGRFEQPEFVEGELGQLLFGNRYRKPEEITGHWLLSLFSPAPDDSVDWQQGNYRVVARTGRVESAAGWGAVKRANQMIAEGGVLVAATAPKGVARDVAPAGFPHPVYRAGFALTIPIGKPKPQPVKAVVVDTKLLESLAAPKEAELAPADAGTEGPVTASPEPAADHAEESRAAAQAEQPSPAHVEEPAASQVEDESAGHADAPTEVHVENPAVEESSVDEAAALDRPAHHAEGSPAVHSEEPPKVAVDEGAPSQAEEPSAAVPVEAEEPSVTQEKESSEAQIHEAVAGPIGEESAVTHIEPEEILKPPAEESTSAPVDEAEPKSDTTPGHPKPPTEAAE